jgi:N-acetylmuramoyl-L-alanine amidase
VTAASGLSYGLRKLSMFVVVTRSRLSALFPGLYPRPAIAEKRRAPLARAAVK